MVHMEEGSERQLPQSVIDKLSESVWRSRQPQLVFGSLSAGEQRAVAATLVARSQFMKFMTLSWCVAALVWVWIVTVSGWDIPAWAIPVSAVGLVILILSSASMWWLRSRILQLLTVTNDRTGE